MTLYTFMIGQTPVIITVDMVVAILIAIIAIRFFKKTLRWISGIAFTMFTLVRMFNLISFLPK